MIPYYIATAFGVLVFVAAFILAWRFTNHDTDTFTRREIAEYEKRVRETGDVGHMPEFDASGSEDLNAKRR